MNRGQRRAHWIARHRQEMRNAQPPRLDGKTEAPSDLPPSPGHVQPHSAVELHVEELLLQGFASRDRHQIADAMQQELGCLFLRLGPPTPIPGGEAAAIDAGSFRVGIGEGPTAVGVQAANAVYECLKQ